MANNRIYIRCTNCGEPIPEFSGMCEECERQIIAEHERFQDEIQEIGGVV